VTRTRRRQLGLLSGSFFAASGLGLLLLILVARWLPPAENAHFQAVWGLIFAFASVLGALEQEVTRRATAAAMDGRRTPVGAVQAISLAAVGCLVLMAALIATPKGQVIVQGSVPVIVLTLLSVLNFAALILARGVLLGAHVLRGYAALLVGEAVLRVVLVGALVLLDVEAALEWAVLATVVGSFVWLGALGRLATSLDWSGRRDPWRRVGGTVAALGIANGLSALVLTGFPAVAAVVLGDPADLAVLFAVITLARTPLALLAPVQALTVPTVVRWSRSGDTHHLSRALQHIAVGSAATAALAAAVGYVVGPWAVALMLGGDYRPGPVMAALVAAATCVMGGALLQAAALVALQRYWQVTACWAAAIASAALVMLAAPWGAEDRGLGGFTVASIMAFVATALAVRRTVATAEGRDQEHAH
jgi:O-antigen/teichoic acid export membrane protein